MVIVVGSSGGGNSCWKKTAANWVVEMLFSNDKQAKNPTDAAVDDQ